MLSLTDDIRLCTICRTGSDDRLGVGVIHQKEGRYHSLVISKDFNNGRSNATLAGVKNKDRLIEINGVNVQNLDHDQVVARFQALSDAESVELLVTDVTTYENYHKRSQRIHSKLPGVRIMESNIPPRSALLDYPTSLNASSYDDDEEEIEEPIQSSSSAIKVIKGDLVRQNTDVIVVCSSSKYLFESICAAGGDRMVSSYTEESRKYPHAPLIGVNADGRLRSKRVYFLPWKGNSDPTILTTTLKKFIFEAIDRAVEERYRSIAFPAIGCGQNRCSIDTVVRAMVEEADQLLDNHSISIQFVVQPERTDIYNQFLERIRSLKMDQSPTPIKAMSLSIGRGVIGVVEGDLTRQEVDVIIGSSSSQFLKGAILDAAGPEVRIAYEKEYRNNPNSPLISIPPGALRCKRLFFIQWAPNPDEKILRESLSDLMLMVVQNVKSHNFQSIAFPAIGCGEHGCSVNIVVETMVTEMKAQLTKRNLPWKVTFVVQRGRDHVYDEFSKQIFRRHDGVYQDDFQIPSIWERGSENQLRFPLSSTSNEYKGIASNFTQAMQDGCSQILRIERIQNERCYMQYRAHRKDFRMRLKVDTEKHLYHGCPVDTSDAIINGYFNRSFAGKNATLYGKGVYFSSNAAFSHKYATADSNGVRCMFLASVLVGKPIRGDNSMITVPTGYDSTTDGNHIFVTYHDAQAFAEYLITYK